ncbi:hypothetical protein E8L90_19410 [Brevibacillus antibioticus]|uniref:Lantibiotic dehydratase N-terminal domain-containing protein n=1 Tax=Brevibacillus antibioticus TaxID=2570228 RepID=A0A4U2Y9P9_9BACL|nr:lantibiotic dehydratase [Brevibacillus antibioticus]TKI57447.1 hypothetical protein E8L90_19410 [Brevibacillus antibioticus]
MQEVTTQAELTVISAEFNLARINVLPLSRLSGLVLENSQQIITQLRILEQQLEDLQDAVLAALHQSIPVLGEQRRLVRYVLKLQRNIFNKRYFLIDPDSIEEIYPILSKEDVISLNRWKIYLKDWQLNHHELLQVLSSEKQRIADNFTDWLMSNDVHLGEMLQGLALASPEMLKAVLDKRIPWNKPAHKAMRAFYRYLQRTVVKTSPFSTFTQVGHAIWEPSSEDINSLMKNQINRDQNDNPRTNIYLNRAVIYHIIAALANNKSWRNSFNYNLSEQAEGEDGVIRFAVKSKYSNGFYWSNVEPFVQNKMLKRLDSLQHRTFSYELFLEHINHSLYLQKLCETLQLLRPIPPVYGEGASFFEQFAEWVCTHRRENWYELELLLRKVAEHLHSLELNSCAQVRINHIFQLRNDLISIFRLLECAAPNWLVKAALIYEEVRTSMPISPLKQEIQNELVQLTSHIKPFFEFHGEYGMLIDLFKSKYTPYAKVPLLDFLSSIACDEQLMSSFQRMMQSGEVVLPRTGKCVPPAVVMYYYQTLPGSSIGLQDDGYGLVINKVAGTIGSIVSRFTKVLGSDYQAAIKDWIKQCFPEAAPIELAIGGDWSSLQGYNGIAEYYCTGIGEISDPIATHVLEEISLRLDKSGEVFEFVDREERVVAPVYVGSVPAYFKQGIMRLLLIMINPWKVNTPYGNNPQPWKTFDLKKGIQHTSRHMFGRVVLSREQWIISVTDIPRFPNHLSDMDLLLSIDKWITENQLPEEVFVTCIGASGHPEGKPIWIHFKNLYSVEFFRSLLSDESVHGLWIQEALPNLSEHQFKDENGNRFASEWMSLVHIHD